MGITVYGRRTLRRLERITGERLVHAAGPWLTTVDHRHLVWEDDADEWVAMPGPCTLNLSSCRLLFGVDWTGERRHFMTGGCGECWVEPAQPHRYDCSILLELLDWPSINPDYWPVPVHRPRWMDYWKQRVRGRDG